MSWFTELMNKGAREESPKVKQTATDCNVERVKVKSAAVKVDLVNSEHLIYDLLFGENAASLAIENSLEQEVVKQVGGALLDPSKLVFEPFPKPLKDALAQIDSDAPIGEIEQSLQQDPVMASNIVKLANSAAFKRSDRNVTSLKMAITFVGLKSLKQIVTAASMNGVMKVSPIYFKLFGEKVWQHSVTTAKLCELAAKEQGLDPYTAFFMGLIHDVGKVAIFKALVKAMKRALPDVQPGSVHFRKMMTSMSEQLTVSIVKDWKLPEEVVEPLEQYIIYKTMSAPNPLTKILVESKLLSELSLLLESDKLSELEAEMILMSHDINVDKLELIKDAVTLK